MNKVNVLSLFDGKSSGFTACELAGVEVDNYYSAEIDKYAIQVSNAIHPNQTRLGSVTEWRDWDIDWSSIDMIFGGFPCQAWSMAGKQLGDKDERGMLFWTMLDIMKHVRHHNPKADFLIENVKMKKEFEEYITFHMNEAVGDVHKILINIALVSAQNRNRYYWTSFPVDQPEDKGVVLADIIEFDYLKENTKGWHKWFNLNSEFQLKKSHSKICSDDLNGKSICMTARQFASWNGNLIRVGRIVGRKLNPETGKRDDYSPDIHTVQYLEPRLDNKSGCLTTVQKDNVLIGDFVYRFLTPRECFRLQTVPEHYIDKILDCGVSNTQLYKIAGNGWTDEVIAHILKCWVNVNPTD